MIIKRSISSPLREELTRKQRWEAEDRGLISCWEKGRKIAAESPEISEAAKNGELPLSAWKGGLKAPLKNKGKYGTLFYLAEWQGLRGEDLIIDTDKEYVLTCTKHETTVIYSNDINKYGK